MGAGIMAGNEGRLPGIMLPADWSAMLMSLDDATLAALIRAAIRYANSDGPDGQDGQDGRAETEAMGLKAKAAPLWLIMRAEIARQIRHTEQLSRAGIRANQVRWARVKSNPNGCERMRSDNNMKKGTEYGENYSHKPLSLGNIIRPDANGSDRMRSDTRAGGRAGGEGTVQSSTKTLSKKENLQKKNGPDGQDGQDGRDGRKKPEKRERIIRVLMHFIRRYYHRRKTTAWSSKEMAQVRKIAVREDVIREMIIIGRAYRGGYQYARHDIITLLNNWTVELDRATQYNTTNQGRRRSHGGSIEQRYGMQ